MGYRIDEDNLLLNDVISVNGNDEFILLLPKAVNKFLIIGRYITIYRLSNLNSRLSPWHNEFFIPLL